MSDRAADGRRGRVRDHLRTNAVAYVALFVALGGTGAWAADKITSKQIARSAVKSKQIANGQVRNQDIGAQSIDQGKLAEGAVGTGKLADEGVTTGKLAEGAVTGAKVADESLTGGDIDESSLSGNGAGVMLATLRDMFAGVGSAVYAPVGVSFPDGGPQVGLAPADFVATDLTVRLDSELADPSAVRAFRLHVDDSDTALACTIASGEQSCSSDERVAVAAGSTVQIRTSMANTTYVEDAAVGWRAITP